MKKNIVLLLAVLVVAAIGCQKKEETSKAPAPQVAAPSAGSPAAAPQSPASPAAPQPASQDPAAAPAGGDPHAGMKLKEMTPGTGHKGKVLEVKDAGGYTYMQVEEKGQKLWVAALKMKVKKGDVVEFPDSKPMENFHSKTLNKTFEKIIFADTLRVAK